MLKTLCLALLAAALCATASAQDHRWTAQVGGGYSPLLGQLSDYLGNGWHITAGGGYNFSPGLSASVNYMFNDFGISRRVLDSVGVHSGNAHLWSLTFDPKLTLRYVGRVRPFVVGGVGYYRMTKPASIPVTTSEPFFSSVGGLGGNLGLGFDYAVRDTGFKVFADVRYHYASADRVVVRMVPLTVGVRW